MSFAHDTFSGRPAGQPGKATDQVVYIFLFMAIIFAISSTKASMTGPLSFIFDWMEEYSGEKISRFTYARRALKEDDSENDSEDSENERKKLIGESNDRKEGTPDEGQSIRGSEAHIGLTILPETDDGSQSSEQPDLSDTETVDRYTLDAIVVKFMARLLVNSVMISILQFAVYSLYVGIIVFVWAELPRPVSIITTMTILICDFLATGTMTFGLIPGFFVDLEKFI